MVTEKIAVLIETIIATSLLRILSPKYIYIYQDFILLGFAFASLPERGNEDIKYFTRIGIEPTLERTPMLPAPRRHQYIPYALFVL